MKQPTKKQRKVHYVLSTHWDREWHESFQNFRYRLVRLIDRVLAGYENGQLKGPFQTDGQAIVLEDYLEIRSEKRAEVERLLRAGLLVAGPWYVMPDEFTVSGESLIRNLRKGRELVREMGGKPSSAGFVCDTFGHNSQLPQIFSGFGIKGAFIWRGVNDIEHRNLRWRGADGTELVCYKFGPIGYCTFAQQVRRLHEHAAPTADAATFGKRLSAFLAAETKATDIEALLIFDGGDHQEWDTTAYSHMYEVWNTAAKGLQLKHSSLDEYLADALPQANKIRTVVSGELREPGKDLHSPGREPLEVCQQWLIPGVLSSRIRLKQANVACETMLCHWAEPFAALATTLTDAEYPQGFLNKAWTYLLRNHPHDSIDACSVDQVHRDMEYRFDQSRLIAETLTREVSHGLAIGAGGAPTGDAIRVALFNSLTQDRDEVVEFDVDVPTDWPCFNEFFGFEAKPSFRLHDSKGREVPYQRLSQTMNKVGKRLRPCRFPQGVMSNRVRVAARMQIPAVGYTTMTATQAGVVRHALPPGLATSDRSMANEFLQVVIESSGTLTITDVRTGQTYGRGMTFEDCADIGDGWFHGAAVNDRVFTSTARSADVSLLHDGPLQTTFAIRTVMPVPKRFLFDRMQRDTELVDMVCESLITLRAGQNHLDIRTNVENAADDHRLRVLFPTGARAAAYWADSQFDVVQRPIALRKDNSNYRELEVETKPQQSWTAVADARRGLAVVAPGLLETAVRDLPERPLALTLFRGTGRTVLTNGEPGGQMRDSLSFAYRLATFRGNPDPVRLGRLGQDLAAGVRCITLRGADAPVEGDPVAVTPAQAGLLKVDGPVLVSSVRSVGGNLEVRIFNPGDRAAKAEIRTSGKLGKAWRSAALVDFESKAISRLTMKAGAVAITVGPRKIVTLQLKMK